MKLFIGSTLFLLLAGVAGAPAFAGQEPDKDKPKEEPRKAGRTSKRLPSPRRNQNRSRPRTRRTTTTPSPKPSTRLRRPSPRSIRIIAPRTNSAPSRPNSTPITMLSTVTPGASRKRNFAPASGQNTTSTCSAAVIASTTAASGSTIPNPWPGDWDYNDDVYIEDVDGQYYLLNPRHPGVRLIVVVGD